MPSSPHAVRDYPIFLVDHEDEIRVHASASVAGIQSKHMDSRRCATDVPGHEIATRLVISIPGLAFMGFNSSLEAFACSGTV